MLSAYPTKHARIGNAVGLDTPASVVRLLAAMAGQGYDIGPLEGDDALPGVADLDGDALIHALIAAGGQDADWLTSEQLEGIRSASRRPSTGPSSRRCRPTCARRWSSTGARRRARCSSTRATDPSSSRR